MMASAADLLWMYFDTDPTWVATLQEWAASESRIDRVWVFGSRVTGVRTPKDDPPAEPDLDVAYTLTGDDAGERLAYSIFREEGWSRALQKAIAAAVDLQFAELDDVCVWPAVKEHGQLIYERT